MYQYILQKNRSRCLQIFEIRFRSTQNANRAEEELFVADSDVGSLYGRIVISRSPRKPALAIGDACCHMGRAVVPSERELGGYSSTQAVCLSSWHARNGKANDGSDSKSKDLKKQITHLCRSEFGLPSSWSMVLGVRVGERKDTSHNWRPDRRGRPAATSHNQPQVVIAS